MTSFAFMLGVIPLLTASGAGAEARKVMGMAVFSGTLIATIIGVIVVPGLYVLIESVVRRKPATPAASSAVSPTKTTH
jgi:HAE1 family hydrophobic/amphiphilic exporter-1